MILEILEVDGSEMYNRIIIGVNAHDALKVLGDGKTFKGGFVPVF